MSYSSGREDRADVAELDDTTTAITDDLFKGGRSRWARVPKSGESSRTTSGTFDEMCKDLTPPSADGDRSNMVYDVAYFDTSTYVYSAPANINALTRHSRLSTPTVDLLEQYRPVYA